LLLTSEGRVLADHVHHALIVVESGKSTAAEVAQALQLLEGTPATVSMVLNKTPVRTNLRDKDYYYPS
jgi:hypothetical protein